MERAENVLTVRKDEWLAGRPAMNEKLESQVIKRSARS
jgi:hypothetical protein